MSREMIIEKDDLCLMYFTSSNIFSRLKCLPHFEHKQSLYLVPSARTTVFIVTGIASR